MPEGIISLSEWNKAKKKVDSSLLPTTGMTPVLKKYEAAAELFESKPTIANGDAAVKALRTLDNIRKDAIKTLQVLFNKSDKAKKNLDIIYQFLFTRLDVAIKDQFKTLQQKIDQIGLDSEVSKVDDEDEKKFIRLMDELLKKRKEVEGARSLDGFDKVASMAKDCQRVISVVLEKTTDKKRTVNYKGRLQILVATEKTMMEEKIKLANIIKEYADKNIKAQEKLKKLGEWATAQAKILITKLPPKGQKLSVDAQNELYEQFLSFENYFWKEAVIFMPGSELRNYRPERLDPALMLKLTKDYFNVTQAVNRKSVEVRDHLKPLMEAATGKKFPDRT